MLAAELETPRMTPQLLLFLDPNDTPAVDAITAGTFCAVSFPTTTHDGNKDGQPELAANKNNVGWDCRPAGEIECLMLMQLAVAPR